MRALVISEKGGVGKSFVASNVIAPGMYVATKQKIRLAELDASNYTTEFYSKSDILEAQTIAIQLDSQKISDEDFLAFLESEELTENGDEEERNIYNEIDRAINQIVMKEFDVVDVGANATVVFLNTLIKKQLVSYFDYIFIVATTNVNEIALAIKSYKILQQNGYGGKTFFIINKYTSSFESKLKHFSELTQENTFKVREFEEYNSKIMTAKITVFDLIVKYKEEEQRKELDKYIRENNKEMIDKIATRLNLLNKAKLFYYTNDFKRLVNLFNLFKR